MRTLGVNTKTYIKDGITYTASNNRPVYDPEFCENHGKLFTKDDLVYLCSMWDSTPKLNIAYALGRTLSTILSKKYYLVRLGLFDYYKKLGKEKI